MSKFSSFAEYPPRSLAGAEAALLTAWASLERFHDDLVLVGGLAVSTAFALDGQPGIDDRQMRERQILEQLVTIGRALAGEG